MQLIIDTQLDSPVQLRAAALFLRALTGDEPTAIRPAPQREAGQPVSPEPAADTPAAPTPPAPQREAGQPVSPEPENAAEVFTRGSTPSDASANDAPATSPSENPSSAPTSTDSGGVVDLDADGLPWDARIHASSKVKNADGRWRSKRGVLDSVVEQVTAQLRAIMSASPTVPTPPAADTPTVPTPPAADTPAVPTPPAAPSLSGFAGLMQKITSAQVTGKITPAGVIDAVRKAGLQALPDLVHRPDLVGVVDAVIDVMIKDDQ